jgi:hypothetical protein
LNMWHIATVKAIHRNGLIRNGFLVIGSRN